MTADSPSSVWQSNPFATRFVRPGSLGYVFPAGANSRQLIDELERNGWRGQIVGPHGSGKSTLLHAILRELDRRQRPAEIVTLSSAGSPQGRLFHGSPPGTLWIVDGFEQLSSRRRRRLLRQAGSNDCGFLVTAHNSVGLPTVYDTHPGLSEVKQLVNQLAESAQLQLSAGEVDRMFNRFNPNIREMLFHLYDRFEARRQSCQQSSATARP